MAPTASYSIWLTLHVSILGVCQTDSYVWQEVGSCSVVRCARTQVLCYDCPVDVVYDIDYTTCIPMCVLLCETCDGIIGTSSQTDD